MRKRLVPVLALLLALGVAVGVGFSIVEQPRRPGGTGNADTVFVNGRIFTADTFSRTVEAVAIDDGKFVAVGSNEEVRRKIGSKTTVHDLEGRMAMPGITDMHVHPIRGGLAELTYCKFSDQLELPRALDAVRTCVAGKKPGEWIEGAQWDTSLASSLDKAALDEIAPKNPVYLHDNTNHVIWVNSAALAAAGIDKSTPDPPNGKILRDRKTGEPTGVLLESAIAMVHKVKPKPESGDIEHAAKWIFQKLNAYGVTSIQTGNAEATHLAALRKLEGKGDLSVRVKANWDFNTPLAPVEPEKMLERFDTRDERGPVSALINPDGGKIYADGIPIGAQSPYLEPYVHEPTHGHAAIDKTSLNAAVKKMDELGLSVMIHAMGDAAVRMSLDAFEAARRANGDGGKRHVIAHTFSVDPADRGRAHKLNVAFENSPPIVMFPNDLTVVVADQLGRKRTREIAPIRSLLDAGESVGYGSDWDNIPEPDPWLALQAMITRRNPASPQSGVLARSEAVDLITGLEILTYNGAHGLGLEKSTGSIAVGKDADLIALDRDLTKTPVNDIHKTKVLRTILRGKTVFARE
ncbi:amidohydrolase [Actinomadura sp. B10D3]|uniref:amidohydrolase n=1 Tax=Actinomadura sp. B10D3 TaxID=3153557 RepID=UPI00325EACC5